MLTDCGNVPWSNLNKAKLNNGYIHLPSSNNPTTTETTSIMDYESSSDAALLDQQEQLQPHSNIINNPTNASNLASPQHVSSMSLRNSISSSPTNKSQTVVVVNLQPNSMQTVTTLQRNNVKNSSTRSNRSGSNLPIGNNNIKPSDNVNIFKAHNNSRKYKFNLLKLSSPASSSSGASRSTRNRVLIFAICLIIFGIAIGALTVHLSEIYHCNLDRIGT